MSSSRKITPERPRTASRGYITEASIQAEESLLSAMMLDGENAVPVALDIVGPDDLYIPANKMILEAITSLYRRQDAIDLTTVCTELDRIGLMAKMPPARHGYEGVTYVSWLVDAAPRAVNVQYYAERIKNASMTRRLAAECAKIMETCEARPGDPEIVDEAEKAILAIGNGGSDRGLLPASEIIAGCVDLIEARSKKPGIISGVPTGLTKLDELTGGLQASELIVLAGRPSMGKTAMAIGIMLRAAASGVMTAMMSIEMARDAIGARFIAHESEVSAFRLRDGTLYKDDWDKIMAASTRISQWPLYVDDDTVGMSAARRKLRALAHKHGGIGLVVIDYIQLMRGSPNAERRDLEVSEISRGLKAIAKELRCPVLALSQLSRKLEERADKRPILSDLRESGAIEQDADVVLFVYRDEVYNRDENNPKRGTAEIIIGKQRNGPLGVAHVAYDAQYMRFRDGKWGGE